MLICSSDHGSVPRADDKGVGSKAKAVADQVAETLAGASVKRIYGVVDDSLSEVTDGLPAPGKIDLLVSELVTKASAHAERT